MKTARTNKGSLKKLIIIFLTFIILISAFGNRVYAKSGKTQDLTSKVSVKKSKGKKMKTSESKKLTSSSIQLLNETIKTDKNGANVFISPTSIMFAFGLAENGAKGKSRSQIENHIYGGLKTADTNQLLCKQMKKLESDKNVKWNVANSIWVIDRPDVKVKNKYLKTVKGYYDAEIYKAPFNDITVKDMNKWVYNNTNKMIPKIVDHFSGDEVMYLINAMAFEGSWAEPFTKHQVSKNQTFTNLDGTTSKTTMLHGNVNGYFDLNGAKGFKKYYKGFDYAFVGIEMPEGVTPADYISQLAASEGTWNSALSDIKTDYDVSIRLPEFKLDYDTEMSETLQGMGVRNAFDKNKANLYNMFKKCPDSNYYFSKVLHKTHIELDRNGTKAAAVTAVVTSKATSVMDPKPHMEIKLDHPFVYAIVDAKTNLPIFIGCMNSL